MAVTPPPRLCRCGATSGTATRRPVRRVPGLGSGGSWVLWTVPEPRRDSVHPSDPATCRANVSRRPVADRCPRRCLRQDIGRWPVDGVVLCVGTSGMPVRADGVCAKVSCVLDGMAQSMARARVHPDVDDGQPVQASRLETPASVQTGAGVGIESNVWLRDNDLDAHGRSKTQFVPACRALRIRLIPWRSSEALRSPTPLP
jgi:hypothetical protein